MNMTETQTGRSWTWTHFKASVVLVAPFFYFLGMMLTDYGASMRIIGSGHGETLIFSHLSPRVLYHAGLLMSMVCF